MSDCPAFAAQGPVTIADSLKAVDCLSGQAVEVAFSRLFGSSGALSQALTLILTLYVALLAVSMLTGRSGLRLNMLTPRMLQLGLVLTFATSWVAYQNVGWNLLVGAPDQVASILLGTKGSATQLFALRLDTLFDVIARSASLSSSANATAATVGVVPQIAGTSPKPADLLWAASLLLLLGTVGVLIVARIALAAVMALGPIFIIMALFRGTRGLFEGWLKAAVMLALTPMLAVLLGGGTLVLIAPMFNALGRAGGKVSLELATSIFLAAFVYTALMILAMRAAGVITGGWRLGSASSDPQASTNEPIALAQQNVIPLNLPALGEQAAQLSNDRVRGMVSAVEGSSVQVSQIVDGATSDRRTTITSISQSRSDPETAVQSRDPRIRPLGQGFRAPNRVAA
jgi:type IV secretion system protein VirB6